MIISNYCDYGVIKFPFSLLPLFSRFKHFSVMNLISTYGEISPNFPSSFMDFQNTSYKPPAPHSFSILTAENTFFYVISIANFKLVVVFFRSLIHSFLSFFRNNDVDVLRLEILFQHFFSLLLIIIIRQHRAGGDPHMVDRAWKGNLRKLFFSLVSVVALWCWCVVAAAIKKLMDLILLIRCVIINKMLKERKTESSGWWKHGFTATRIKWGYQWKFPHSSFSLMLLLYVLCCVASCKRLKMCSTNP